MCNYCRDCAKISKNREEISRPAPRENRGIVTKDGLKKPSEIKTETSVSAPPPPMPDATEIYVPNMPSTLGGYNACFKCGIMLKEKKLTNIDDRYYCKKCAKIISNNKKQIIKQDYIIKQPAECNDIRNPEPMPDPDAFKQKGIGLVGFKSDGIRRPCHQQDTDQDGNERCNNCCKSLKRRHEVKIGNLIYCKKCTKKISDEAKREFVDDDDWGVKGI
jgi:hypothetical protein